jgi:hypothetical protein
LIENIIFRRGKMRFETGVMSQILETSAVVIGASSGFPIPEELTFVQAAHSGYRPHQAGLAGAIGSHELKDLARPQPERQVPAQAAFAAP